MPFGRPGRAARQQGRDGRHAPSHPNGDRGACQPIAVSSQESSRSCAVACGQARSRSGRGAPIATRRSREEPPAQGQALAGLQTPSGRIKAQARRDEATAQKDRLKDFGERARRNALSASRRASMGSLGFTRRELCAPPSARESKKLDAPQIARTARASLSHNPRIRRHANILHLPDLLLPSPWLDWAASTGNRLLRHQLPEPPRSARDHPAFFAFGTIAQYSFASSSVMPRLR